MTDVLGAIIWWSIGAVIVIFVVGSIIQSGGDEDSSSSRSSSSDISLSDMEDLAAPDLDYGFVDPRD